MAERFDEQLAYRLNTMNPSKIEQLLCIGPGAPDSLAEAARRVVGGEPVVQDEPAAGPAADPEPRWS